MLKSPTSVNIFSVLYNFFRAFNLNVRYQMVSFNKLHVDRYGDESVSAAAALDPFEVQIKFYVLHLSVASFCSLSLNSAVSAMIFTLPQQHPIHPTSSQRGTKLCVIRLGRESRRETHQASIDLILPQIISGPDMERRCAAVRLLL